LFLLQLKRQDDSVYASRAVLALARFMIQKGQLEDAAFHYRTLNRDFGKTLVRDGRTGTDFFNEMASDKRLLPYLDPQRVPGIGAKIRAREVLGNFSSPLVFFESSGEPLPFAQRYRFALSLNPLKLQLHDTTNDAECWSQNLANEPRIQKLIPDTIPFPSHHLGHLMVLSLGSRVYGLEPAEHKVVWDGLVDADTPEVVQTVHAPEGQTPLPKHPAESSVKLGLVEGSCVCIQIGTDVVALEPLHGRVLWTRADVAAGSDAFGDDQYVFLADVHDGAAVQRKGLALRAQDGSLVTVPDWVALYRRRLGVVGRHFLLSESNPKTGTTLRLYDVVSGQNLWKKVFTANALIVQCQDPNLTGLVEPSDGRLTVFNSRTGNDLFLAQINVRDLDQVHDLQLFSDTSMHYLALNRPTTLQKDLVGAVRPGVGANTRTAAVNGKVYAFDRTSGKVRWYANVANQVLVLDQFNKMGILLFAARSNRPVNQMDHFVVTVKSIDKRSGRLLFEKEYPFQGKLFNVITNNSRGGSVELVRQDLQIVHTPDN